MKNSTEIKSVTTGTQDDMELAERQLVRRIDLKIIPFIFMLHLASFLDRVNIGHARLYGLEQALGITGNQYAMGLSVFFIGYVSLEVPSNLMMKRTSPPRWISLIMITWGIATMASAAIKNYPQLLITRALLGAAEAGFFPGVIHYLSFWYTRKEQGFRIALLTCASSLASSISGPISYSIKNLDTVGGLSSWQWIFIMEGIPTVILGLLTWGLMPDSPSKASWLSNEQQVLLKDRLIASHVQLTPQPFDMKQFLSAFTDYKTYCYMINYFCFMLPMYSIALLMPTIIKDFNFTTEQTMLLTCPPYVFALLFNLLISYNSDRTLNRGFHVMAAASCAIIGFSMLLLSSHQIVNYIAMFFVAAGVSSGTAPLLSWSNNNLVGSTKAATCSGLIIMFGNSGGIIAGQLYNAADSPRYTVSHTINLVCLSCAIVMVMLIRLLLKRENRRLATDHKSPGPPFQYIL